MQSYYIQSFSKGQVTIPKKIRKQLNMGDNFTLKLTLQDGKIVAEPVDTEQKSFHYPTPSLNLSQVFDLARTTKNGKSLSDNEMIDIAKDEHAQQK